MNMTRKKKTVNSNENSLISDTDMVDMPSISGKKKAAEPRQEKQISIILNETNTSSGLTQMQNLTIDDFDLRFRVSAHTTLF